LPNNVQTQELPFLRVFRKKNQIPNRQAEHPEIFIYCVEMEYLGQMENLKQKLLEI
jgi:hypothetical protein